MGMIVGRIETGTAPKYLLRYFRSPWDVGRIPCEDTLIVDMWPGNAANWCNLFDTRSEARKWWEWQVKLADRERQRRQEQQEQEHQSAGLPN